MSSACVTYDDVVHRIYDSALRPERLQDVLASICTLTGSTFGNLYSLPFDEASGGYLFTTFPVGTLEKYLPIAGEDPHLLAARERGLLVAGVAVSNDELVAEREFRRSSVYQQIWEPLGIRWMCGGTIFDAGDSHHLPAVIAVHRPGSAPPYDAGDRDVLRRLLAHLARAMGIMFHLRDRELRLAATRSALDQLASGVVLLRGDGSLEHANRAACEALRTGPLTLRRDPTTGVDRLAIEGASKWFDRVLQAAVQRALEPILADVAHPFQQALVIDGSDGRPGAVLHVAPLPLAHSFGSDGGEPRAIAFLYDLRKAANVSQEVVRDALGLTAGEARVALAVLDGGDAEEIAARLGISPHTVRAHLRGIYEKTRIHRRADLLKLLLSLARA